MATAIQITLSAHLTTVRSSEKSLSYRVTKAIKAIDAKMANANHWPKRLGRTDEAEQLLLGCSLSSFGMVIVATVVELDNKEAGSNVDAS